MTQLSPRDPFVRRVSGHFGRLSRWEGHEIIELNSPALHVKVSLTRGAEILELRSKKLDLDLMWHGHEDIVRNRPAIQSINAPIGNFLDNFSGGWQEVLPAAQYPIEYKGAAIGAHGEVAMLSWDYRILIDDPDSMSVEFSVDLRRFPMRLVRVMTLQDGVLRFDESAENLSGQSLDFQWGHHLVIGGPFINEGTEILVNNGERIEIPNYPSPTYRFFADSESEWPLAQKRTGEIVDVTRLPESDGTDGHLILGPMEEAAVALRNHDLKTDIRLTWDKKIFPYCWIWMVFGGIPGWPLWGRERLVTIEPFSSPVISLTDAIAEGKTLRLDSQEKITSWVRFELSIQLPFNTLTDGKPGQ
jgi:galactose mutarotase-like enzyme